MIPNGNRLKATRQMLRQPREPAAHTKEGGIVGGDADLLILSTDHGFNALTAVALVGNQDVGQFVMYPPTIAAAQAADDQNDDCASRVNIPTAPAAYYVQRPAATGARNPLRAPDKKTPSEAFPTSSKSDTITMLGGRRPCAVAVTTAREKGTSLFLP
jgi:hypothetical protein